MKIEDHWHWTWAPPAVPQPQEKQGVAEKISKISGCRQIQEHSGHHVVQLSEASCRAGSSRSLRGGSLLRKEASQGEQGERRWKKEKGSRCLNQSTLPSHHLLLQRNLSTSGLAVGQGLAPCGSWNLHQDCQLHSR